ncbi:MAG TPA: SRPBCC family protein [Planctomicrobium sp.]|nr:SRPBCC family protein [Planctomicrobium sp.]
MEEDTGRDTPTPVHNTLEAGQNETSRQNSIFVFSRPLGRRDFIVSLTVIFLVKYLIEAGLVAYLIGKFYSPLDFLNPIYSYRFQYLETLPDWMSIIYFLWTFPFIWALVVLSVRRTYSAGGSPSMGIFVLIPWVNVAILLALACAPEYRRSKTPAPATAQFREMNLIAATVIGISGGVLTAVLGTSLMLSNDFSQYGLTLFLGLPILATAVSTALTNSVSSLNGVQAAIQGLLTLVVTAGALILFAFEGVICLFMLAPLAIPLALLGGIIGKLITDAVDYQNQSVGLMVIFLPTISVVDQTLPPPPERIVTTSVEINAPIQTVWDRFIDFQEITGPRHWIFSTGVAYPIRAEITGHGAGAVRHCIFSTGPFVEPITAWDEPHRLAFDVTEQPHPMVELSFYKNLHPPHLSGMLQSKRGEIRLETLPNGNTLLTGNTWYEFHAEPVNYWYTWCDWVIHRIHIEVLEQVKKIAETQTQNEAVQNVSKFEALTR